MFKQQYNELHGFLEWRRQTRFIRHYGGPIMAVGLFVTCVWSVWRALESRQAQQESTPIVETKRLQEIDRTLHTAKTPRW